MLYICTKHRICLAALEIVTKIHPSYLVTMCTIQIINKKGMLHIVMFGDYVDYSKYTDICRHSVVNIKFQTLLKIFSCSRNNISIR